MGSWYSMQDGRIVESGTHESLTMPENGYYSKGTVAYHKLKPRLTRLYTQQDYTSTCGKCNAWIRS